jgi:hypothetical protein
MNVSSYSIFGKIRGEVLGDYVRIEDKNTALVELLLAAQAKKSINEAHFKDRRIVIFRGNDGDGEYMGWRTVSDASSATGLEVIAEHVV